MRHPTLSLAARSGAALRGALTALALPLILALPAGLATAPAQAAVPAQQKTQAPGFYRMALGDFEITALYDGYIDLDRGLLSGISAEDLQSLLARMFIAGTPGVQTAVNAYLVHTGSNLVLVDTGAARSFGPTLGAILANIRAAGYDPAQVDTVLLTHLHPDHANGLLTPEGAPAFPNAVVRVAKADADFWLSEETAAKAPQDRQPFFAMARGAVAPYAAAGRFQPYQPGEDLLSGVTAVPAAGHTPGHAGYLFRSGDRSILMWGDLVHSHAVQFARPEVAIEFDTDKAQAVAARQRIFADAAAQALWVAGAHLPFPGIGHVRAEAMGYTWVPVEYGPIRTDR